MATCAACGSVKLIERVCPKCGRMNNVGNPKPFTDAEKLDNLMRGLQETGMEVAGMPVLVDPAMPADAFELRGKTTVRVKTTNE